MSDYSSTREGFQRAMEWCLQGEPGQAKEFVQSTSTDSFYQILNGERRNYEEYIKGIHEVRAMANDFKPVVHEFLRDGDQLAARITGTFKIKDDKGSDTGASFESFIFAKVDEKTGKLEWTIERSVQGPANESAAND